MTFHSDIAKRPRKSRGPKLPAKRARRLRSTPHETKAWKDMSGSEILALVGGDVRAHLLAFAAAVPEGTPFDEAIHAAVARWRKEVIGNVGGHWIPKHRRGA